MTPTKPRKATQISTQMWDKLLQAARVYAGLFDYRAAAIRIGKNEGWTESELVEVGVIEPLSEVQQEKFNRRYKEFPMLSASPIRETPRNDPAAQIIEHVAPDELEPWAREGRTPTVDEVLEFDKKHNIGPHGIANEKAAPERRSPERGQEEPKSKGSGKEPSGATD